MINLHINITTFAPRKANLNKYNKKKHHEKGNL